MTLTLMSVAIFFGSATHRCTGIGSLLIAAPVLSAGLGPHDGVATANWLGLFISLTILGAKWRLVDIGSVVRLTVGAAAATPVALIVIGVVARPELTVLVGTLTLLAVLLSAMPLQNTRITNSSSGLAFGALSGFMNVTAASGGPPVAAYAALKRWEPARSVPTMQLFFLVSNAIAVLVKEPPSLPVGVLSAFVVAAALGLATGAKIASSYSAKALRKLMLVTAASAAAFLIIQGVAAA